MIEYVKRIVVVGMAFMLLMIPGKAEPPPESASVVEVLEKLDCEYSYSYIRTFFRLREVLETNYADYSIVKEANLKLIERTEKQERDREKVFDTIYELYQDDNGEYMALVRVGEKVYCAQYINDEDSQICYDTAKFPEEVYVYEWTSDSCLMRRYGKSAYFLDGAYVCIQYTSQMTPACCIKRFGPNLVCYLDSFDGDVRNQEKRDEGDGFIEVEMP